MARRAAVTVFLVVLSAFLVLYFILPSPIGLRPASEPVTLVGVGDSIGYRVRVENLSNLTSIIGPTDIFIFNLEGVLDNSSNGSLVCEGFPNQSILRSDKAFAGYMKAAPVTIANLANNHALDCGPEGLRRTLRVLSQSKINAVGAGLNLTEACKPLLVQVRDWRIAFVSYDFVIPELVAATPNNPGVATFDGCRHDYTKIKSEGVDLVVASIHYGFWSSEVTEEQARIVSGLLGAGVDVVMEHSPHMPQALMAKDGRVAFFSLGNFIFRPDYEMPPLAYTSIVPRISFFKDRVDVVIRPIRIDTDGIPHLDPGTETIQRITEASVAFNTVLRIEGNVGYLSIVRSASVTSTTLAAPTEQEARLFDAIGTCG